VKRRAGLWRALYWLAILAIVAEALGLTATFRELKRRRAEDAAELAPDQIAAVARLWPSLTPAQKPEVLHALSWSGLNYRVVAEAPTAAPDEAHVRAIETAVSRRLDGVETVALIHASRPNRPGNWPLSSLPVRVFVRVAPSEWLEADVRGELGARFFGLPTGFWVGVVGLLLAAGVLTMILREGRAIARISRALEAFSATGAPQPLAVGGSPEVAALARRALDMQQQVASLLRERTAMLGAIAHDIKTYVQRLKLRLDLLDDPTQLEKAGLDLDAMNAFVEDALLLAVNAEPLIEARTFDISEIAAREAEAAQLAGGKVALTGDGDGPWLVHGDPVGVSRALGNIVGNALRYGGEARVTITRRGANIVTTVDDRGPGVPPAEREAVFSAFRRGEASRSRETGGSGLGLAIARSVVVRHGGTIAIDDAPGGGARVTVALPVSDFPRAAK
jgi:two-component system osmolarity sensor histidine kinase EnvZ